MLFSEWWSMQWFPVKYLMVRSNHNYLSAVIFIWGGNKQKARHAVWRGHVLCDPSGWHWLYWMRNGKFTRKSGVTNSASRSVLGDYRTLTNFKLGCHNRRLQKAVGLKRLNLSQKHLPVCVPACAASLPAASSLSFGCNVVWQAFFPLENLEELGFHVHSWRSFSGTSTGSLVELKQFMCNRPWSNCLGALLFCKGLLHDLF